MHRDIHLRATFSVHLPLGPVVSQYSGCATWLPFRVKYNNINYKYHTTTLTQHIILIIINIREYSTVEEYL